MPGLAALSLKRMRQRFTEVTISYTGIDSLIKGFRRLTWKKISVTIVIAPTPKSYERLDNSAVRPVLIGERFGRFLRNHLQASQWLEQDSDLDNADCVMVLVVLSHLPSFPG
jgi:hypothetical protein